MTDPSTPEERDARLVRFARDTIARGLAEDVESLLRERDRLLRLAASLSAPGGVPREVPFGDELTPVASAFESDSENDEGDSTPVQLPDYQFANGVVSTLRHQAQAGDALTDPPELRRHQLLLDLDVEAHLIPSSTPGHSHLYVRVPGGIIWAKVVPVLEALAAAGVLEPGYASASKKRGFTTLRIPSVRKQQGAA